MAKKGITRTYFKEEQSLSSSPQMWIMYLTFLVSVGITGYGLYQQLLLEKPWGNHPTSNTHMEIVFAAILIFMGALVFFMHRLKLLTQIDETSISIRFAPLQRKPRVITKEEISRYEIRKYRPIIEYGGWGLRTRRDSIISYRRRHFGIAYNVKGNMGLQLYLTNGKKILIGTQNPTGIERAMKKLMEEEGGIVDG